MKKRLFLLVVVVSLTLSATAQTGIQFFQGTFADALAQAKKEKKQIFIDFYTEWCGPCMIMSKTVFTLPEVGEIYNSKFINLKIDAEKGEGVELAKKYKVTSYPTYIFVNPLTQESTHRSGGNKPAADFIADTKGALDSKKSSAYLNEKFAKGDYDKDFLIDYIQMKKVSGDREAAAKLFDQLILMDATLKEQRVWDLYVDCVEGYKNPYLMEVSNHYQEYCQLYGKKSVDQKLTSATKYAPIETLGKLCDFDGKILNDRTTELSNTIRNNDYGKASKLIDEMLADKSLDPQKVIENISFHVRMRPKYDYDSLPYEWIVKQVETLRYIAYNNYNRDDVNSHYVYAFGLEYLIKRSIKEGKIMPASFAETPPYGKGVYDTRPAELKQKPGVVENQTKKVRTK